MKSLWGFQSTQWGCCRCCLVFVEMFLVVAAIEQLIYSANFGRKIDKICKCLTCAHQPGVSRAEYLWFYWIGIMQEFFTWNVSPVTLYNRKKITSRKITENNKNNNNSTVHDFICMTSAQLITEFSWKYIIIVFLIRQLSSGVVARTMQRCLVKCPVIFCYFVSSRPGRPPKRSPLMGITSPQHDVLMKMKKPRMDNGDYLPYENGHGHGHSAGAHAALHWLTFPT